MLCIKDRMPHQKCDEVYNGKAKRAYGKWIVSKEFFIRNHGSDYFFVGDGMHALQLSQTRNNGTYETIVDLKFFLKDYLKYE